MLCPFIIPTFNIESACMWLTYILFLTLKQTIDYIANEAEMQDLTFFMTMTNNFKFGTDDYAINTIEYP